RSPAGCGHCFFESINAVANAASAGGNLQPLEQRPSTPGDVIRERGPRTPWRNPVDFFDQRNPYGRPARDESPDQGRPVTAWACGELGTFCTLNPTLWQGGI